MQIIKQTWDLLAEKYAVSATLSNQIFQDITKAYTQKNRHYHTLVHIADLLAQTNIHENQIQDIDSIYFAIFFHDIVYKPTRADNEEQSAQYAQKIMQSIKVNPTQIQKVDEYILATKKHLPMPMNTDLQFFLDADLSILASDPSRYLLYTQQIRKEYSIYPDFAYKNGRKKALLSFLEREKIFYFYQDDKERQARENIKNEIDSQ